jgi:hypothetical protein
VVEPGLVVDRVHGDAPDTPQNPDPPHQGSLHATTVVPADPPDSTVSPQGRFSWRIGARGRVWWSIVHKILPQAQMLHNLGAGWTERPLSAASRPQRPAGGRGGHFRTWHAARGMHRIRRGARIHHNNRRGISAFATGGVLVTNVVLAGWYDLAGDALAVGRLTGSTLIRPCRQPGQAPRLPPLSRSDERRYEITSHGRSTTTSW